MITQTNPPAILHPLADIKSFLGFWMPLWHLRRLFLISAYSHPCLRHFSTGGLPDGGEKLSGGVETLGL